MSVVDGGEESRQHAIEALDRGMEDIGLEPVVRPAAGSAHRSVRSPSDARNLRLTEEDSILHWEMPGAAVATRGRRKVVKEYRFEEITPNQVCDRLQRLDRHLTPASGLREVKVGGMSPCESGRPVGDGRILLLVHGTFSNCDTMLAEFAATAPGRDFLGWATSGNFYDQMLTFDHPTLSVSPLLNAVELARAFDGTRAQVDIICHSRGGLVTRWWLEMLSPPEAMARRAIFVGSPLAGTGLAAPARLRQTLDLIANLGKNMSVGAGVCGGVFPMAAALFHASAALAGILTSICTAGSRTSLVDAVVAMIPGLAAQSRQGANGELLCLREAYTAPNLQKRLAAQVDHYAFIMANFESDDPGWKFWKYFRNWKDHVLNVSTNCVFEGENDLVVDSASMVDLTDRAAMPSLDTGRQILDFGTTGLVHHCNYFLQPETIAFIRQTLESGCRT